MTLINKMLCSQACFKSRARSRPIILISSTWAAPDSIMGLDEGVIINSVLGVRFRITSVIDFFFLSCYDFIYFLDFY